MKIPGFKRLFKSDFAAENQSLIEQLANILNTGIEVLYQALNKNVSINENLLATVADVEVIVDGDGFPTADTSFALDIKTRVQGLTIINATFVPGSTAQGNVYPSGGVFATWSQNKTNIQLNHITGLPSGKRFKLRVLAYG